MLDRDGIRILNDEERRSASADRLMDIQRQLVRISKLLTAIVVTLWIFFIVAAFHFPPR